MSPRAVGLCYLGAFQYVQYTLWFPRLFPGSGAVVVAKRVAFDQLINTGLWYYPLFYSVQSCVINGQFDAPTAYEGLERYKQNVATDMVNVRCPLPRVRAHTQAHLNCAHPAYISPTARPSAVLEAVGADAGDQLLHRARAHARPLCGGRLVRVVVHPLGASW